MRKLGHYCPSMKDHAWGVSALNAERNLFHFSDRGVSIDIYCPKKGGTEQRWY